MSSILLPLIGVIMLIAKWLEVSFLQNLSWWWCLLPFGLAFIYWEFIDSVFHFSAKSYMRKHRKKEALLKKAHAEEMLSNKLYSDEKKR